MKKILEEIVRRQQNEMSEKGHNSNKPHSIDRLADTLDPISLGTESSFNDQLSSRYGLAQNRKLEFVKFWSFLFDALRAFDDDCTAAYNELDDGTLKMIKWRRTLSVCLCQYYRWHISTLLSSEYGSVNDGIDGQSLCKFLSGKKDR